VDYSIGDTVRAEQILILIGIGLPLCYIGYFLGGLSQSKKTIEPLYDRDWERVGPRAYAIRVFAIFGHVLFSLSWIELFENKRHIKNWLVFIRTVLAILYSFTVSKVYANWKAILLHIMLAYLLFAIFRYSTNPQTHVLADAFLIYLPVLQLSFWIWFKRFV